MAKSRWEEVKGKLDLVTAWARDGLTEDQIAHNLGIGMSTLSKYKVEHIEIVEALKQGKEVVDYQVENQLLKRAMGYTYEEVTRETRIIDGEPIMFETKRVTKEVVPDVTAQIFWLKNRKPNEWRDKKDLDVTNKMVIFEDVDLDE